MELVVIAPRLLALPAASLAGSATLARLAAWSTHACVGGALDDALLALPGMRRATAGAIHARAAGVDCGDGAWFVADPVALVAGRDDVTVAARAEGLDAAFVARTLARLNAHFAQDGLRFVAPRVQRWLVHVAGDPDVEFVHTDVALGGSAYVHRPRGRDARRFERYANEIQMLLHDAPENALREEAEAAPFSGLWLWGAAGAGADAALATRVDATGTPGAEGDLVRGLALASGGRVRGTDGGFAIEDPDAAALLVALPAFTPQNFDALDAAWLAPAVDALAAHAVTQLTLLADGERTHRWIARAPSVAARLRARIAMRRFRVPS